MDSGSVFHRSMELSIDYMLQVYNVDAMLYWFRKRSGQASIPGACSGRSDNRCNSITFCFPLMFFFLLPRPPTHQQGSPQGWDKCADNLRNDANMCLKGTVASAFLMGAGGVLRWREDAELLARFSAVVAGITAAVEADGFAAAFSPDETMYRENPNYVTSWLIHALLEADVVVAQQRQQQQQQQQQQQRSNAPAKTQTPLEVARGMIDWFNSPATNWLLPEFMPADRTTGTIPPQYGANQGHQIYLISQGIIHNTRMATSAAGKQRDVDVVSSLYQEDEWLTQLTNKDTDGIWLKKWFPHNYEVCCRHHVHLVVLVFLLSFRICLPPF